MAKGTAVALGAAVLVIATAAMTLMPGHEARGQSGALVAPGLVLPRMNPQNGKQLFASKGCVVCHSINGVGGEDAAALDAETMEPVMSPFDFLAKMWGGAEAMIDMQKDELGHQIEFTGQDLADIVAFVHNRALQRTFKESDIPDEIRGLMKSEEDGMDMGGDGDMMK